MQRCLAASLWGIVENSKYINNLYVFIGKAAIKVIDFGNFQIDSQADSIFLTFDLVRSQDEFIMFNIEHIFSVYCVITQLKTNWRSE